MKITIEQTITRKKTIDIDAPYFFCLDWGGDGYDCYAYGKVREHGEFFTIQYYSNHNKDTVEWKLCQDAEMPNGWHLKKNKISRSKFLDKIEDALKVLSMEMKES
jgi:hypothetical protein